VSVVSLPLQNAASPVMVTDGGVQPAFATRGKASRQRRRAAARRTDVIKRIVGSPRDGNRK
jgi:hypothetical protein